MTRNGPNIHTKDAWIARVTECLKNDIESEVNASKYCQRNPSEIQIRYKIALCHAGMGKLCEWDFIDQKLKM